MAGFAIADRQSVLVTAAEEQIAGPLGAQDLFAQQLAGESVTPSPARQSASAVSSVSV